MTKPKRGVIIIKLPFISRKKLLKEIDKLYADINYEIDVWKLGNSPLKEDRIYGLKSEATGLYAVQYYIQHNKHWKTLKLIKHSENLCPHGYEDWDECPDCCH